MITSIPQDNRGQEELVERAIRDRAVMEDLVALLNHHNSVTRGDARRLLVRVGPPAVPVLIEAMKNRQERVRWEAAKALGDLEDPRAAEPLVQALKDPKFGVRWLAADGLIGLGREGLAPLLRALIDEPESAWMREGAHHVLHSLSGGGLRRLLEPVVEALEGIEPTIEAPVAANDVLEQLAPGSFSGH